MSFGRYMRRNLVESPYITMSAVLSVVGVALPTIKYFFGGMQQEQANKFSFTREMNIDPRTTTDLPSNASNADIERRAAQLNKQYVQQRREAAQ